MVEASDPEVLFHLKRRRDSNSWVIVPPAFTDSFLEAEWRSDHKPLLDSVPWTSATAKPGLCHRAPPVETPLPPAVPRSRFSTQPAPRPADDGGAARGWLTRVCKHCEAVGGAPRPSVPWGKRGRGELRGGASFADRITARSPASCWQLTLRRVFLVSKSSFLRRDHHSRAGLGSEKSTPGAAGKRSLPPRVSNGRRRKFRHTL